MKQDLQHYGRRVSVAIAAAIFTFGIIFSNSALATPPPVSRSPVKLPMPVVLTLATNVTSLEIQQALDSLPNDGGTVVLPAGYYLVTQPIVLDRNDQTLRGAGDTTVLELATNADCPVIIMGQAINHPTKTIKHLLVAGILIDGNRLHQSRELWRPAGEGSEIRNNGIVVQRVSDSTVENVTCARCRSGGLVTTREVVRLTVRHLNSFENQFDGLACYQTEQSLFTDLYLHDNPGAGISLDLAFNHNVISNAVLLANDLGVFMRSSRHNQFYNLTIHNSHHYGVFMANAEMLAAGHDVPAPETECVGNAFTNLTATNCGGAAFRVNNVTCTNNVIIRPIFAENLKGGISQVQPDLVAVQ